MARSSCYLTYLWDLTWKWLLARTLHSVAFLLEYMAMGFFPSVKLQFWVNYSFNHGWTPERYLWYCNVKPLKTLWNTFRGWQVYKPCTIYYLLIKSLIFSRPWWATRTHYSFLECYWLASCENWFIFTGYSQSKHTLKTKVLIKLSFKISLIIIDLICEMDSRQTFSTVPQTTAT